MQEQIDEKKEIITKKIHDSFTNKKRISCFLLESSSIQKNADNMGKYPMLSAWMTPLQT